MRKSTFDSEISCVSIIKPNGHPRETGEVSCFRSSALFIKQRLSAKVLLKDPCELYELHELLKFIQLASTFYLAIPACE